MDTLDSADRPTNTRVAGQAALEIINLFNFGVAIVGPRRRTVLLNEAARKVIEQSSVLELRANVIGFARTPLESWLLGHYRRYCLENSVKSIPDGDRRLLFSIHLLPNLDVASHNPLFFLSLNHSPVSANSGSERISCLFSLTDREAEVSELLIGGYAIRNIAELLGVKESTVRTHTKKIYLKTRVSRQTDLIRLGMLLNAWSSHSKNI